MYLISFTNKFKKDVKLCKKRNYNFSEFKTVLSALETEGEVPNKYKPHKLIGNYSDHWECHIKPDWLLIWFIDDENKEITLVRTGTHSDLF
jgi:mRNA interferase YafQ